MYVYILLPHNECFTGSTLDPKLYSFQVNLIHLTKVPVLLQFVHLNSVWKQGQLVHDHHDVWEKRSKHLKRHQTYDWNLDLPYTAPSLEMNSSKILCGMTSKSPLASPLWAWRASFQVPEIGKEGLFLSSHVVPMCQKMDWSVRL